MGGLWPIDAVAVQSFLELKWVKAGEAGDSIGNMNIYVWPATTIIAQIKYVCCTFTVRESS